MPGSWEKWTLRSWQAWPASMYAGPAHFGVDFADDGTSVRPPVAELLAYRLATIDADRHGEGDTPLDGGEATELSAPTGDFIEHAEEEIEIIY
eukprot:10977781-Heterocapsa_arctica.AAC.1